jgi:putative tryptophan/tyrosine transport system substrate-binding protein
MQIDRIRRREFITALGGAAAAAWPLAVRAAPSMPVIGLIMTTAGDIGARRLDAFRRGLMETGYVEGQNVAIEHRFVEGRYDMVAELVADLLARRVTILATLGVALAARAAKAATASVPIVFVVAQDPVKLDLVASLARPGGNLTGVNFLGTELAGKELGLLRELLPAATRVAVLVNPANVTAATTLRAAQVAADTAGVQMQAISAATSGEINAAFARLVRDRPDALFVSGDGLFNTRRSQLVNLASRHAIPAIYGERIFPEIGGLMSYGSDPRDAYRVAGLYVGRILKGAKPADLPVEQASKFELVINAETARMLGLTVPPSLLALADEVIE